MLKRKAEVIMLATEKASSDKQLFIIHNKLELGTFVKGIKSTSNCVAQELYFIIHERPKPNEWYISHDNRLLQWNKDLEELVQSHVGMFNEMSKDLPKKVIASSDTTLLVGNDSNPLKNYFLPQPSDSFIKRYIETFNQGVPIVDVMIDYEWNEKYGNGTVTYNDRYKLKLDKNNTITITRIKESWNKEEIIQFMDDWYDKNIFDSYLNELIDKNLSGESLSFSKSDVGKKWIENNL
jgi:hypothetical protein